MTSCMDSGPKSLMVKRTSEMDSAIYGHSRQQKNFKTLQANWSGIRLVSTSSAWKAFLWRPCRTHVGYPVVPNSALVTDAKLPPI